MFELTVVLISKNQEWNIGRLIESVLTHTEWAQSREVILVDSASTDRTVEIASEYPIRILKLSDQQFLSPAAGRYIGYQNTSGKYVLFLDGDNELYPRWSQLAASILETNDDVAGLTGKRVLLEEDATDADKPSLVDVATDAFEPIKYTGGCAMFKRSVLEEVGSFNPFLHSDEEPDLAMRIRYAGYRLVRTLYPISYDYAPAVDLVSTKIRRWRRNLYLGAGQNLRYRLGTGAFWSYLRERGFGVIPLIGLFVGLLALVWSVLRLEMYWFGFWVAAVVLLIAADTMRKRSLYLSFVSLVHRLVVADGTLRGFLKKPLDPSEYQSRHIVVQ